MSTLLIVLAAPALAQNPADWQFVAGAVLEPDPSVAWASQSISNPSVVYDSIRDRYLMFFESRTPSTYAVCPQGVWNVGVATSSDGVSWTIDPTPVVAPNPNSAALFYNCVAAHPTAYYSPNAWGDSDGFVYVYFKSEQRQDACTGGGSKTWGCGPYTGVGLAVTCFDNGGDPYRCSLVNRPVLFNGDARTPIGSPHVVRMDNTYRMTVAVYPDIFEAVGSAYNRYTLNSTPLLEKDVLRQTVPWIRDEIFNPALLCNDDLAGNMDYAMFVGGRDTSNGQVVTGAWSKAVSDRSVISYVLDTTPQQSFTGNDAWRHWEVRKLLNAAGEYVIYFDERQAGGGNYIRLGVTDPSLTWNDADFGGYRCD